MNTTKILCLIMVPALLIGVALPCACIPALRSKDKNKAKIEVHDSFHLGHSDESKPECSSKKPEIPKLSKTPNLSLKKEVPREPTYKQMKIFKFWFDYFGDRLKYDEQVGNEIRQKAESNMPSLEKWLESHLELVGNKEGQLRQYGEDVNKLMVDYCIKLKAGVCRQFAALLMAVGRKIGVDTYLITNEDHVANLYKWQGKWYVSDLTNRIALGKNKIGDLFMVPLDIYLKFIMDVKNLDDRKNISVWMGYNRIPLENFLTSH